MHEESTVKTWLTGFYFADTSIDASLLTNVELAGTYEQLSSINKTIFKLTLS